MWRAQRQRTLSFERRTMTGGAMLIVKIMAIERLLLVVDYRTRVGFLSVESRSWREE
jgi:hypothetical protein